MSDNLKLWDMVQVTPNEHAKKFDRGGFKGHSVNPLYLAKRATEIFGPVGIGWGVESLETITDTMANGTVLVSEHVRLWYVWEEKRAEISQWASEKQAYITSKGEGYLLVDDEARKKCRTNALSKCFSYLGFSADLWFGYYDSQAYVEKRMQEQDRSNKAEEMKEDYRGLCNLLDDIFGCKGNEEHWLSICRWATEDETLELGDIKVTPNKANEITQSLADQKEKGIKPSEVLQVANYWCQENGENE